MPDTPQPFDLNAIAESLKKNTETITSFIKMVAGWIRDKQWVELISFVLSAVRSVERRKKSKKIEYYR
jgi:hypothetical protein